MSRAPPNGVLAILWASTRIYSGRRLLIEEGIARKVFEDAEQSSLTALRAWVLEQGVTEIEMREPQFWNFAALQHIAEKPWVTFMGRHVRRNRHARK
jgi:hypothetical protein